MMMMMTMNTVCDDYFDQTSDQGSLYGLRVNRVADSRFRFAPVAETCFTAWIHHVLHPIITTGRRILNRITAVHWSFNRIHHVAPSSTWFHESAHSKGILIGSGVSAGLTNVPNEQTHRQTRTPWKIRSRSRNFSCQYVHYSNTMFPLWVYNVKFSSTYFEVGVHFYTVWKRFFTVKSNRYYYYYYYYFDPLSRATKRRRCLYCILGPSHQRLRYDTIRDAILTCARKPTWVGLIYRRETTTKNIVKQKN